MTQYQLTENSETGKSISVFYADGRNTVVPGNHPRFDDIANALRTGDSEADVKALIDTAAPIKEYVSLSERVTMRNGKLYFDGDRIKGTLTKHIVRMAKAGSDVTSLVRFLERLYQNPSERSRDSLYNWLMDRDFTITPDGDFIAYKGVCANGLSVRSGTAMVDGVKVTGQIPNRPGNVITMPRKKINDNSSVGCAEGLHAGTYEYARGWAQGMVLTVRINPRDVVAVPNDSQFQKLRVCRYEVIEAVEVPCTEPVYVTFVKVGSDCSPDCDGDCTDCR